VNVQAKTAESLLDVRGLGVRFATDDGVVRAVDGVSFALRRGTVLGIVGESGSGKSVACMTLLGLTRSPVTVFEGQALYKGVDLIALRDDELRRYRGSELAMIFQDPMTSLNPVVRIGDQIVEMIRAHGSVSRRQARRRTAELLREVGIPHPAERIDSYPHEFSGGMRQRVMIAMALACDPEVLIADEPTTALDVTIQSQIIQLIARLRDSRDASVILITHDLGVIADIADEVIVMYAGRVVEGGTKRQIFYDPQHPYTWGLLGSIPRLDRPRPERLYSIPGSPPSLIDPPPGCKFRPRCAHAFEACVEEPSLELRGGGPGQLDRCWLDAEAKTALRLQTLADRSVPVGDNTP
jgi:oligopeptide/dipeptide ABC transporter ATP-binding protein